jgi:hypothetical protein
MLGWILWPAGVLLGLIGLAYIGVPAVVRAVFRKQRVNLVPIEEHDLPPAVQAYLRQSGDQLRGLGFEEVGWFADRDEAASQTSHCVVLARPAERVLAMAAVVVNEQPPGDRLGAGMVELSSDFEDGHNLCTSNSDEILFPARTRPHRTTVQVPWCGSVAELVETHLRLSAWVAAARETALAPVAPGDPYRVPTRMQAAEHVRAAVTRDFDLYVERGYMRAENRQGSDRFRLTWKGAYLLTWRQQWPITPLLRRRRARRVRELLQRISSP